MGYCEYRFLSRVRWFGNDFHEWTVNMTIGLNQEHRVATYYAGIHSVL